MAVRQAFRKLLKNLSPVMYTTSTLLAYCASSQKPSVEEKLKLDRLDVKRLTYEFMMQQSALDAVNSATQLLTVTYMTITSLSAEYRTLLNKLISLLTETLNCDASDAHWDLIMEVRTEMEEKKETLVRLTGYMDCAHKMAMAASELSFLCGLDSLSSTLCQRIEDALSNVKAEIGNNLELEGAYRHVQEQCIKDSKRVE